MNDEVYRLPDAAGAGRGVGLWSDSWPEGTHYALACDKGPMAWRRAQRRFQLPHDDQRTLEQ